MHFFYSGTKKSTGLVMDKIKSTTPKAIYSLRKVTKNAPANTIRVRRSSDNAESDIGFIGNNLNTDALLSFVGKENLIANSEALNTILSAFNTSWSAADSVVAPDGTTTADTLSNTTSNTGHSAYRTHTIVAGNSYTFSIYAKAGTISTIQFAVSGTAFTAARWANFDLTGSGSVTLESGVSATIASVGNGWYRLTITPSIAAVSTTALPALAFINSPTAGNLPTFIGSASDNVILWGLQLNTGTSATDYVKTVSGIGGDGYVTTWYNQVVGEQDVTQATAGDQPRIVSAGVLFTQNDKPSVDWFSITQDNKGLIAPANVSVYQSMCVFSMRAGCGANSRITGDMRISTSAGTGFWVSAHNGTQTGAINANPAQDFATIPVLTTYPLSIIWLQATAATVRTGIGNIYLSPRSWYGGISEVMHFNGNLSAEETSKFIKEQSKYYGIAL